MATIQYPDLSKPRDEEIPDLSKPIKKPSHFDTLSHAYNLLTQKGMPLERPAQMLGAEAMFIAPELTPNIPTIAGRPIVNALAQMGANAGRVGVSGYGGAKIMPGNNEEEARLAGKVGAGFAAGATPFELALGNANPLVRIGARSGLGALAGYGLGHLAGYPMAGAGFGATAGGLLGMRGNVAPELAARTMGQAVSPEMLQQAVARQQQASHLGMQLTPAEATGSPVLANMERNAASSPAGGQVMHPFLQNRAQQEEGAINQFLNQVSPPNAYETIENQAFRRAEETGRERNTRVNVNPVIDFINREIPQHAEGSKIHTALNNARERLEKTPASVRSHGQEVAPINRTINEINSLQTNTRESLRRLLRERDQFEKGAPSSYFRESSTHAQNEARLNQEIEQHENLLQQLTRQRSDLQRASAMYPYETTIQGLHNAKLGIRGLIEGQGENALGNTAAGRLRRVESNLIRQLRGASPEYAEATHISNLRQAREEIENSMASHAFTGRDFYSRILRNRNEFDDLYHRLRNPRSPEEVTPAQQSLTAMREVFPHLIDNIERSAKGVSKDIGDVGFNFNSLMKSFIKNTYFDTYNRAIAELIVNPNWASEIQRIRNLPAREQGPSMERLIAKASAMMVAS